MILSKVTDFINWLFGPKKKSHQNKQPSKNTVIPILVYGCFMYGTFFIEDWLLQSMPAADRENVLFLALFAIGFWLFFMLIILLILIVYRLLSAKSLPRSLGFIVILFLVTLPILSFVEYTFSMCSMLGGTEVWYGGGLEECQTPNGQIISDW